MLDISVVIVYTLSVLLQIIQLIRTVHSSTEQKKGFDIVNGVFCIAAVYYRK